MKVAIIGGGASGVFAAIRIKELHPDYDVCIFERNEKLLKKIFATGNGRCNFANSSSINGVYNHDDFAESIIKDFDYKALITYFEKIGIPSRKIDNLYYPYSLSAATVAMMFDQKLKEHNVRVRLGSIFYSYAKKGNQYDLFINENHYLVDKIIFACGGKSSPQFGTDGNMFEQFIKHGYKIKELKPSLCPIKVKENLKMIDGVRAKAKVSLFANDKFIYEEFGEVQFRSDALSGLVNFAMAFFINKLNLSKKDNIKLVIDFVPETKEKIDKENYFGYLTLKLAQYLIKHDIDIHNAEFNFKDFYSFKNSQVSSGGISIDFVNKNLESVIEKSIYFTGEVLDIDAKCGGFNLMFAFASANKVAKSL